jgi:hypothetical protein
MPLQTGQAGRQAGRQAGNLVTAAARREEGREQAGRQARQRECSVAQRSVGV